MSCAECGLGLGKYLLLTDLIKFKMKQKSAQKHKSEASNFGV